MLSPADLDVVMVLDNPCQWRSRLANFLRAENAVIAQGVSLTTVELAHGMHDFDLPDREGVRRVRLRTDDICWRKENLIGIGLAAIPDWRFGCAMDADMIMMNADWPIRTLHALHRHKMVQVSSDLIWLQADGNFSGHTKSLMYWYIRSRAHARQDKFYEPGKAIELLDVGYPGGIWAYRRDAYEAMGGLLDVCLLGAADYHMIYALLDLPDLLLTDNDYTVAYRDALKAWRGHASPAIDSDIGYVSGIVFHLWHGPLKARCYSTREQILIRNKYDPTTDIVRDRHGLTHLAGNKPKLRDDIRAYFFERNEDSIDPQ